MKNNSIGNLKPIRLPEPVFDGGKTVFEALKMRRTSRSIGDKAISLQILADILWAAQGVNRIKGPFEGPGWTAGSASNSQEICIYFTRKEGAYVYEPDYQQMTPVIAEDIRPLAIGPGQRTSGANAPVRLVYVVNIDKFKTAGY